MLVNTIERTKIGIRQMGANGVDRWVDGGTDVDRARRLQDLGSFDRERLPPAGAKADDDERGQRIRWHIVLPQEIRSESKPAGTITLRARGAR